MPAAVGAWVVAAIAQPAGTGLALCATASARDVVIAPLDR